mmetsp:Transcript_47543/g.142016  ORF Transcript_47543/g.142016 Transcript_47543/m.142016 type:complete len:276 (-) Transcript_47543:63-890(-)
MTCSELPAGVGEPPGTHEDAADGKAAATPSTAQGPGVSTPGGLSTATTTDPSDDSEETGTESETDSDHRFSPQDTVIIFDWDDTVFPSTWVKEQIPNSGGAPEIAPWQQDCLAQISDLARETLVTAKQFGSVLLVTNAEQGWIDLSCHTFMPALAPVLADVRILSARTMYETPSISSPHVWKMKAFESEISRAFLTDLGGCRRKNIISLGDSSHERVALMAVTENLPNCRTKSLKFVERPDIGQLCEQHLFVARCLERIVHHDGNLDLFVRETLS